MLRFVSDACSFSDGDMGFEGEGSAQYENADGAEEAASPVKLSSAAADDDGDGAQHRSAPERLFGTQRTVRAIARARQRSVLVTVLLAQSHLNPSRPTFLQSTTTNTLNNPLSPTSLHVSRRQISAADSRVHPTSRRRRRRCNAAPQTFALPRDCDSSL